MKYFVVSDIHGFADELKSGLNQAGFNKRNKNHILIVCGDLFDRGSQNIEVYKFLKSIPKKRCILIRGNHEHLYFELLNKKYPQPHDFHNFTVDTFCEIAGSSKYNNIDIVDYLDSGVNDTRQKIWKDIQAKVKQSEITKWLQSDQWKDYYEVDNYIFVHSFIPHIDNWREATKADWEEAAWGCPWQQFKDGYFDKEIENNKILVCGHWHTSDFYFNLKNYHLYNYSAEKIYFSKNLIAIDGGVRYISSMSKLYHPQNVLIIDNNKCYNKFGDELKEVEYIQKIETVIC